MKFQFPPRYFAGFVFAAVLATTTACLKGQSTRPAPATRPANHVVLISIDGCRPDALLRARTPVIHALMSEGSYTFYAQTIELASTLPAHASMITGVPVAKHGIDFDLDPPEDQQVFPKVPTFLDIAHKQGLTTGLFSTKSKFRVFARPGSIDYQYIDKEVMSPDDMKTATEAAKAIIDHKPGAMLVHLGNTDRIGHLNGWGSPEQLDAIAAADTAAGAVIKALKEANIYSDTLIIVTADHGGAGIQHGPGDIRSRLIPWIAVGPGIRKDYDLTRDFDLTVHTEDTFATICHFLQLPVPADIDGKPVLQILSDIPAATQAKP